MLIHEPQRPTEKWRDVIDYEFIERLSSKGLDRKTAEKLKMLPIAVRRIEERKRGIFHKDKDMELLIAFWDKQPELLEEQNLVSKVRALGGEFQSVSRIVYLEIPSNEVDALLISAFPTSYSSFDSTSQTLITGVEEDVVLKDGEDYFWDLDLRDSSSRIGHTIHGFTAGFYRVDRDTRKKVPLNEPLQFLFFVLQRALEEGATDVHFDASWAKILPEGGIHATDEYVVRFTVDGKIQEALRLNARQYSDELPLPRRICAAINVNSSIGHKYEGRGHASGRATLKYKGQLYDLRIQVFSQNEGESYTIRILPQSASWNISNLGFSELNMQRIYYAINNLLYGMIYVTGPTGSGKSTTVYALLMEIAKQRDRKIVSIEDPVEYRIPGVQQVPYNEKFGQTFEEMVKVFLRCAPHVIFVGETRNKVVADVAAQAAETGHLVISTLHANDATSVFSRLLSLGLREDLLHSALELIIAQRLVRVIDPAAWLFEEGPASELIGPAWTKSGLEDRIVRVATRPITSDPRSWYRGRIAVHEVLLVTDEIRDLVRQAYNTRNDSGVSISKSHIKAKAIEQGMRTMWQDGLLKLDQKTSPDGRVVTLHSLSEQVRPDQGFLVTLSDGKWDLVERL